MMNMIKEMLAAVYEALMEPAAEHDVRSGTLADMAGFYDPYGSFAAMNPDMVFWPMPGTTFNI